MPGSSRLSNSIVDIISSDPERLQLLQPDLLKEGQFVAEVEIQVVSEFDDFQNFEFELIGSVLIPILLKSFVAMSSDREHEPVSVQWSLQIQTASEQNLPIHRVPNLTNAGRLFARFVLPLDVLS